MLGWPVGEQGPIQDRRVGRTAPQASALDQGPLPAPPCDSRRHQWEQWEVRLAPLGPLAWAFLPFHRDVDPRDVDPRDVDLRDVDLRDVDPRDVDPRDVDPRDVDLRDVDLRDVDLRDVDLRDVDPDVEQTRAPLD